MKILIMFDYDELEKKKFQNMFNFMKDVEVTFGNLSDIKYNDVVFAKGRILIPMIILAKFYL